MDKPNEGPEFVPARCPECGNKGSHRVWADDEGNAHVDVAICMVKHRHHSRKSLILRPVPPSRVAGDGHLESAFMGPVGMRSSP